MSLPASDHFNGKTFFQPDDLRPGGRRRDLLRWKLTARRRRWPEQVTAEPQAPPPVPRADDVVATWIGHSTFLLRTPCFTALTDPVFSDRASPFAWAGPRRVQPPAIALAALPPIDAVLLSHDHYDHCDLGSLRALAKGAAGDAVFVAPLRHRDLLASAGARRIVELDWWERHTLGQQAGVTLTPARHWSNRLGSPRNHRLWGGYLLTLGEKRVWFVGDTAYAGEIFRAVRERCGAPDLALVPIGGYEPRWFMESVHINPVEAVQLHRDVGARLSVAMHWGAFQLADEGRDDPVRELVAARAAAGVPEADFRILPPGASVAI